MKVEVPLITLRKTVQEDLNRFYEMHQDKEANFMAAFITKLDKENFMKKWSELILNTEVNLQSILLNNEVIGFVSKFLRLEKWEVAYAIDKEHWGQGFTSKALESFLRIENTRPLYARVAFDNKGFQKVLEKCGFSFLEKMSFFADARGKEIDEYLYQICEK